MKQASATGALAVRAGGLGTIIAVFCGAMTLLHLTRAVAERHMQNRIRRLHSLRRAIVGTQKYHVVAVLGPPRATIGRGDYRADDMWYYAIDQRRHVALAIEFADGVARHTQIVTGT